MNTKHKRAQLCLLALLAGGLSTGAAHAQVTSTYDLNIASQPLNEALKAFAQQSGLQVVFYTEVTSGYRAPAVQGKLTRDQALAELLRGTQLTFRQINNNTVEVATAGADPSTGASDARDRGFRLAQAEAAAPAGEAAAASADALEEIVVTAQKREERLEDVPASITVFTRSQIDKSAIVRFEDYANFTPGLNAELGADERSYDVTIRGIGQLGGQASNFGLYLDEFELTGASAGDVGADLADVERIEVLRGPQGTSFGRNVIAGAVNMTSVAPSHEGIFGTVELEAANHGGRAVRGAVNLPLVDGRLAMRLSGSHREHKGWVRNIGPTGQSNDYERDGVRASFRYTPFERMRIDAAVAMQKFDQGRPNTVTDGHIIGVFSYYQAMMDAGRGALPPGTLPAGCATHYPQQNDCVSTDTRDFTKSETMLTTLRAQYDFDTFLLVSVSGYLNSRVESQGDFDDSEFNLFVNDTPFNRNNFWSTELRAQSNGEGPLGWIAGVYYSNADNHILSNTSLGSDTGLVTTVDGVEEFPSDILLFGDQILDDITSKAVFGELSYRFAERFKIVGGLRYNDDRTRESQVDSWNLLDGGPLADETQAAESSKVTGRVSFQFEPTQDTNLYATVARGYRAGGIQLLTPFKPSFGPEQADNYEIGAKAFFFNRRAALNVAAFHTDWNDVQISTYDFATGRNFTDNVGRAKVYGAEVEARIMPATGLEISTGLSFLDTEVVDFINGSGISMAGLRLPNTPDFTGNVIVDYERPMFGSVRGFVRTSYLHMSNRLESLDDPDLLEYLPSYDLVDLRLGVRGKGWMAEVFGENVLDEIYSGGVLLSGFSLTGSGITSPRPSYGVRMLKNF
jgi:iron complex outermembrane receptor protein